MTSTWVEGGGQSPPACLRLRQSEVTSIVRRSQTGQAKNGRERDREAGREHRRPKAQSA